MFSEELASDSPKTRALISHGGFNSFQEAINSATPIIAVPLFGDQPANAKMAEKRGFGLILHKSNINEETITKTLRKVLEDKRYICFYFLASAVSFFFWSFGIWSI